MDVGDIETLEDGQEPITSSFLPSSPSQPSRKLLVRDLQIGYIKNSCFMPVTNFAVRCTGYVVDSKLSKSANGFLIEVLQKTDIAINPAQYEELQRPSYYLSWKDMSTQNAILSALSSKKLWTAPSKEQYLPLHMKELCEDYMKSESPHRVLPVECIGLQNDTNPPTWVLALDFEVTVKDGVAEKVPKAQSSYKVIGDVEESGLTLLGDMGKLDSGESLVNLIAIMKKFMGDNFQASLLVIGGLVLAVHSERIMAIYGDGVPLIMAYGLPVTGKSTAVEAAMAIIGQREKTGECTVAGALEMIRERTVPFCWDDADNFTVVEKLAVAAFNKSKKKTGQNSSQKHEVLRTAKEPRTVPLITMNPQTLPKAVKNDAEKLTRVFTRVAVIPFGSINTAQSLETSLRLKRELKTAFNNVIVSVGKILELRDGCFVQQLENADLYKEIVKMKAMAELDLRSSQNFCLLLYSAGKLLESLGIKDEYFPELKSWVANVLVPHQKELLKPTITETNSPCAQVVQSATHGLKDVIHQLVEAASSNPKVVKTFFNPKFVARKCGCGEVFGFNVCDSLAYIGMPDQENALRNYIRTSKIGCNGKKILFLSGQRLGSHIKRSFVRRDLIDQLDKEYKVESCDKKHATSTFTNYNDADLSMPDDADNQFLITKPSDEKRAMATFTDDANQSPPDDIDNPSPIIRTKPSDEKRAMATFTDDAEQSPPDDIDNPSPITRTKPSDEKRAMATFTDDADQLLSDDIDNPSPITRTKRSDEKRKTATSSNDADKPQPDDLHNQSSRSNKNRKKRKAQDPLEDALATYYKPKHQVQHCSQK